GHGPFSHLFDQMFMPQANGNEEWKHEDASVQMFEYLLEENREQLTEMGNAELEGNDLVFIKELIRGVPLMEGSVEAWPHEGRGEVKSFLYEIVSNKQNGIDVDKFDYFARDCHHLGLKNNFDHMRYFKFTRVIEVEGNKHICTRDKEAGNLYDLFYTRDRLHRRACQHKVKMSVDIMIKDALLKANNQIEFKGRDEQFFTISKAKDDMKAYIQLTDYVFEQILNSSSSELREAREILHNIVCRRLYKCLGQTQPDKTVTVSQVSSAVSLQPQDFIVNVIVMDYGMKEKNPINNVRFYCKNDPNKAIQIRKNQVSKLLPEHFAEQLIRVYFKKTDSESLEAAKKHFIQWCMNKNFSKPQDGDIIAPELTPLKASWCNNNEGENSDEANPKERNKNLVNGQKKIKTQLFKKN
uniref:SAM domain and HD domain 1 n=1 Tax=Oryzias sinensis TaxID=183150 RepID=A0A8C8DP52_9TELE